MTRKHFPSIGYPQMTTLPCWSKANDHIKNNTVSYVRWFCANLKMATDHIFCVDLSNLNFIPSRANFFVIHFFRTPVKILIDIRQNPATDPIYELNLPNPTHQSNLPFLPTNPNLPIQPSNKSNLPIPTYQSNLPSNLPIQFTNPNLPIQPANPTY